jgi:hypothetical protein
VKAGPVALLRTIYELPELQQPIPTAKPRAYKYSSIDGLLENTFTTKDGCMFWKGPINPITLYPRCSIGPNQYYVHRLVAFHKHIKNRRLRAFLWRIKILMVCHTCDRPPCINPDHLVIATAEWNTHDAQTKGRIPTAKPKLPSKPKPDKVRKPKRRSVTELLQEHLARTGTD